MLSTPDYHISQQMKSPVQFFTLDLPVGRIIAKVILLWKLVLYLRWAIIPKMPYNMERLADNNMPNVSPCVCLTVISLTSKEKPCFCGIWFSIQKNSSNSCFLYLAQCSSFLLKTAGFIFSCIYDFCASVLFVPNSLVWALIVTLFFHLLTDLQETYMRRTASCLAAGSFTHVITFCLSDG